MNVSLQDIEALATGSEADLLAVVKPYLPALAREGADLYNAFLKHLFDRNWAAIDGLMYEKMLPEERAALEQEVLGDAYSAAMARYNGIQLTTAILKDVAVKLLIKILVGSALSSLGISTKDAPANG